MTLSMCWRFALLVLLAQGAISTCTAETIVPSTLPWSVLQVREIADLEQAVRREGDFWRVDTPHFVVRTGVDAHFTAELGCYLEFFTATAVAELELPPPREVQPADLTVYDSQSSYRRGIGSKARSRGQFDWFYGGIDALPYYTVQTYVSRPDERDFNHFCLPILNHEVTHFLLQCRAGRHRIPDAIHEGVATYMQAWDVFHDTAWNHDHRHSAFAAELRRSVAAATLPGFSSLLTAVRWDVDNFGPRTNERYASAESFIAFLHATPARLPFFHALLLTAFIGGDTSSLMARDGIGLEGHWRNDLHLGAPLPAASREAIAAVGADRTRDHGSSASASAHRQESTGN